MPAMFAGMTGRVIRYRRRPSRGWLILALLCWLAGAAVAQWWSAPERAHWPEARPRRAAELAVGGMAGAWIMVIVTAHLWFPQLRAPRR